jgi:cell division septal protein FtsQ
MKKIKRQRRPPGYYQKRLLLVLGVVILFLLWYFSDKWLTAKNLECYTQYGNCPQVIVDSLHGFYGTHLLQPLPKAKVVAKLKTFIEIKTINLYRRLPDTLVLSLEMRKPIGTLGSQVLGTHVISDDEGVVIGQTDKANFPLLLDPEVLGLGNRLGGDQVVALKLLGQMNSLSEGQIVGKIASGQLTVYFPENFIVLLDLSHITSNWYTTLQVILTRSKIQSKLPKVIDLRFSSPIVTF